MAQFDIVTKIKCFFLKIKNTFFNFFLSLVFVLFFLNLEFEDYMF
jgi:hypothetical protein